jgi:hypothetical protein
MSKPHTSSTPESRKAVARVCPKRLKKDEPAFFRWLGAIEVGAGSIEDDLRAARQSRGKAPRHR